MPLYGSAIPRSEKGAANGVAELDGSQNVLANGMHATTTLILSAGNSDPGLEITQNGIFFGEDGANGHAPVWRGTNSPWSIGGDAGVPGQVITSTGNATSPVWSVPNGTFKRVTADVTNSTVVNSDVTGLTFTAAASEIWSYEFNLQTGCNNSGGVNFALSVPAGATHKTVAVGMAGTGTSMTSSVITGAASTANFNVVNSANGWVRITGVVENSTTAGPVQLRFKSGTDTQTSTVFANSYLASRKVA